MRQIPKDNKDESEKGSKMKIYMKVTDDKYELPLAVADSIKELSIILGIKEQSIRACLYRKRKFGIKTNYICVEIEESE